MEDNPQQLEEENRRLREKVEQLETLVGARKAVRYRLVRIVAGTFAGKPLYHSISRLVDDLSERRVDRETIRDVAYATLKRLTRVGTVTLLLALAPLTLALLQTYYLKKQNEKFDIQNKRIEQQTYLQEAERRSSLVFLFDNVLDRMDDELRRNPATRELTPQLIGRIVALSKALKPYRYLEGDTITSRMSSPERGQLLLSLLASKLSRNTYDQIFLLADFSYSTLQNVNLDKAYLANINLSYAQLESVSLSGADLRNANFDGSEWTDAHVVFTPAQPFPANFNFANFHRAALRTSDLSGGSFAYTNFTGARLQGVVFREAFFHAAKFPLAAADSLDFERAVLLNTGFSLVSRSPVYFSFEGARVDTSTFRQLDALPLQRRLQVDFNRPEYRVTRDTFYPDDHSKPVIVVDTAELFRL
ncbi:MAG TPA: pentapeptide repeat-containing protein [Saprospiraceae bacterium]|nr:pentapeptide repeat-containing protein [Saprospiraceae bacterium]